MYTQYIHVGDINGCNGRCDMYNQQYAVCTYMDMFQNRDLSIKTAD